MLNINPTDIAKDLRKNPFPRITYGGPSIFDHDYATLIATGQINELRLQVYTAIMKRIMEKNANGTTSENTTDSISE
jgi:hypothetical protein